MKKRIISFITVIILVFINIIMPQVANATESNTNSSLTSYNIQNNFNDGIIFKAYNWSFNNIKSKLINIKDAGYSIIEVSQVQGTRDARIENSSWQTMSQPINQKIGNAQLGTRDELKDLCTKAHEYGLKVIVEAEMNHMAFNDSKDGINPLVDLEMQNDEFYHDLGKCTNWNNRWSVTQENTDGMDLNTQNPMVQDMALAFLNDCVSIGVDGFRFSKASSIETELGNDEGQAWASDYWRYVLNNLNNKDSLIIYGDVSNNGANNENAYSKFMNISSEKSADLLRTAITSKNLTPYYNYLSRNATIGYYENAESFNLGDSSSLTDSQRKICWALIASRANTSPELFVRPGATIGASSEDIYNDQDIKAINSFHRKMKNNSEVVKQINDNMMLIERGTQGAVIVNLGNDTTVNASTNLEDGVYENKASSGGTFIVSNGKISGELGKEQIAVFYKEKKVYFKNPLNWSKVSIFVYDEASNNIKPWPGEQMVKEENGLYSYTFPQGWENKNSYVIFNDNGDVAKEAGHQIPETKLSGLYCDGNSMIYDVSKNMLLPYYKEGFIIGALGTNKSSPCIKGENVEIMASAGGVSGKISYEFYIKKDNIVNVIQAYSINNTVNWNTTEKGTYIIGVNAKDDLGNIVNKEIQYEVKDAQIINGLSIDKNSPQVTNGELVVKADASNGIGQGQYEFYTIKNGIEKIIRTYSDENSSKWIPTEKGHYNVGVRVKDETGKVISKEIEYDVYDALQIKDLTLDKNLYQEQGKAVNITSNASGGYGEVKYKFEAVNGTETVMLQDYSSNNNISWVPSETGNYKINVYAKDANNNIVNKSQNITITAPIVIEQFKTDAKIGQTVGDEINLSALVSGGAGTLKYNFVVKKGQEYKTIQSYSEKNTAKWIPTESGTYTIAVEVKDELDTIVYKIIDNVQIQDLRINSFTANLESPQSVGKLITLNSVTSGGVGVLQTKFSVFDGLATNTIKDYSIVENASWTPTKAGTYDLWCDLKDATGKVVSKKITFVINDVSIEPKIDEFTASVASPQVIGTGITLSTASSGGIGAVQTKITVNDGTTTTTLKDYSTDTTASWTPTKAGTYTINAIAKDSTGKEVTKSLTYVINNVLGIDNFTASLASPQVTGTGITLSTTLSGGTGALQTKFTVNDGTTTTTLKDYSTDTTASWTPTKAGTYTINALVKDSTGKEVTKSLTYVINNTLGIDNFTASLASPQVTGTGITLSTTSSGGTGAVQTKITVNDGTTTTTLKDYSTDTTASWTPTKAGTYTINAIAKDSTGKEVTKSLTYVIDNVSTKNETTIYYNGYSTPYIHYKVGSGNWTSAPGVAMVPSTEMPGYTHKITIDLGAADTLTACFNNGSGSWDSKNGANYNFNSGTYEYSGGVITKISDQVKTFGIDSFTTNVQSPQIIGAAITLNTASSNGTGTVQTKFTVNDGITTATLKDYSTDTTASWTPTKAGTYTINAIAKDSTGKEVTKSLTYVINNVLGIDNFTTSVASPQDKGTGITLQTMSSGGIGTVQTKFTISDGTTLTVLKDYSAEGQFVWTPTKAGTYTINALVKDSTGKEVTKSLTYAINNTLGIDNFTASLASPQVIGTGITLSTTSSGGIGTIQTKFTVNDGTTTTSLKDYSTDTTASWTPTKAGTYTINAIAKDSTGKEVTKSLTYVINNVSTKNETTIYYNGYSTPYIHYKVGSGNWTSAPGVAMTQTTEMPGYTHKITIDLGAADILTACFNNGSGSWDSKNGANYNFNAGTYEVSNGTITKIQDPVKAFAINNFVASVASPQVIGTGITLSTTSSNGTGAVQTKFTVSDGTTTTTLKDYSTDTTASWTPTKAGTYIINAMAKDSTGKEVTKSLTYVINNVLGIDNFTTSVASPQDKGTGITLKTMSSGGIGTVQTKFTISDGTTVTVLKDYSAEGQFVWTPTKAGTYTINALVKDSTGKEVTKSLTYVINNTLGIDNFTASLASPQVTGTGITLSTTSSGGIGAVQTKFTVNDGTTTTTLKDYSTDTAASWTPTKAGTYTINAIAKDSTGKEVTKSLTYVINNVSTKNETTIYYNGYSTPYIHYKVGSGNWTSVPGVAMTQTTEMPGYTHKITIDLGVADTLTACFNNGSGSWDSKNGANYNFNAGTYDYSNGTITKVQ